MFMNKFSKNKLEAVAKQIDDKRVSFNEALAPHSWMKVGGPADLFFVATSADDLKLAVKAAFAHGVSYTVLGGGSNVLIKDGGIRGLVIKNRAEKISLAGVTGKREGSSMDVSGAVVKAESGVVVNQLVRYTIEESLAGLEEFLGIPGTVGGAVFNNSHHLDHLIGDYISEVGVVNEAGEEIVYKNSEMGFDYDDSRLQGTKEVVLWAKFSLIKGDKKQLWQLAEAALRRRRDTQPLEMPSSGCMFKNIGKANAIRFNTPNGATGAGFLIDQAGLKGLKQGKAMVSDKHANFIINTGGASAKDVMKLSELVFKKVKDKYGVQMQKEVFFIGED